jgi:hypothetical protein
VPDAVREFLDRFGGDEDIASTRLKYHRGARFQRDRIAAAADWSAAHFPGDFIEIGAFRGETTAVLGEVAERHGRKVVVVDPWQLGTQNCEGGEYEAFLSNTERFGARIEVIRASSLTDETKAEIARRPLSFAVVDGLHSYEACLSDILAVDHCAGMIEVDDLGVMAARNEDGTLVDLSSTEGRYDEAIRSAFRRAAHLLGRGAVHHRFCREGYLLPPKSS